MAKKLSSWFLQNHVALIAITAFIILGSMNKPSAVPCTTGYNVQGVDLRKFMIDSLVTKRYEGGIFKKADLIGAINSMLSDSIYILNGMVGCNPAKGTGLVMTSPKDTSFAYVAWYGSLQEPSAHGYCKPCPRRVCCPQSYCVVNTNRFNIQYQPYNPNKGWQNNTENKLSEPSSAEQK